MFRAHCSTSSAQGAHSRAEGTPAGTAVRRARRRGGMDWFAACIVALRSRICGNGESRLTSIARVRRGSQLPQPDPERCRLRVVEAERRIQPPDDLVLRVGDQVRIGHDNRDRPRGTT